MTNYSALPTENLKDMVLRHEKAGATDRPAYRSAMEELAKRQSKALKPDVTISLLRKSAQEGKFTSYKAVSEANGTVWAKVHWQMPDHLDYILRLCHINGWPLLTALCVNSENIATGDLAESSLAGFVKGARRLGYSITDEAAFLRKCQQDCFMWGKEK